MYFDSEMLLHFALPPNITEAQLLSIRTDRHADIIPTIPIESAVDSFDARPARAYKWESGKAARDCDRVEIWKLEEKQSDVALALQAFSDAIRKEVDQIIFITNDADFQPAMQLIRQHTSAIIGLIVPTKPDTGSVNVELEKHAHWIRRHILEDEIAQSQLPPMVRRRHDVIHKPLSWYARPDLLIPIFEEAKRVRGSSGGARKWLNQPCAHLDGRIPITMCEQDDTARVLRSYMDRYAVEFGLAQDTCNKQLTK